MSASLVGSEMCIRDSTLRPLRTADLRSERSHCRSGLGRGLGLAPPAGACLLYTSDAADDM
eukprot:3339737-Alexandrium_andersonii.AAC.1